MTIQTSTRRQWRVPAALMVLCAVPVLAGAFRIAQLTSGAPITPDNARFFASPVPVWNAPDATAISERRHRMFWLTGCVSCRVLANRLRKPPGTGEPAA